MPAYKLIKFKLNKAGVRDLLLKGPGIQGVLNSKAQEVAGRCGFGTEISPYVGRTRANVSITPDTWDDYETNLETNGLLKALY